MYIFSDIYNTFFDKTVKVSEVFLDLNTTKKIFFITSP